MLRGYRSIVFAIGLTLAPLLVVGQGPENLDPDKPVEQRPADSEPSNQTAVKAEPMGDAVTDGAGAPTDPSANAHHDSRQDQESEKPNGDALQFWGDTWAQWAMAVTGFLALLVSAWAVWLIRLTLREAREATEAAVKAAVAAENSNTILQVDQRPWLTLKRNFRCEFIPHGEDRASIKWEYTLRNHGKTPALDVAIHTKLVRSDDIFVGRNLTKTAMDVALIDKLDRIAKRVIFPGETTLPFNGRIGQAFDTTGKRHLLVVCLTYRGAGIEGVGVESRAFIISHEPDDEDGAMEWVLREDPGAAIVE